MSSTVASETAAFYRPLVTSLLSLYPANRAQVKVLVPGAGLDRLAIDIAMEGFDCQGSEFSLYMFASNFILNKCQAVECYKIQLYIHQFSNNLSSKDQLREIRIPNLDPNTLPEDAKFSMATGVFLEVYSTLNMSPAMTVSSPVSSLTVLTTSFSSSRLSTGFSSRAVPGSTSALSCTISQT